MFFTARRQPPAAAIATPVAVIAKPDALDAAKDERAGCGWFDSSFELSRGLEVSDAPAGVDFDLWLLAFDTEQGLKH